jgi:uncharacterized membrane protein
MKEIDKVWQFDNIEKAFLAIAGLFGCVFVLITPPFQVADEYLHFYRAFQISERQWIAQQQVGDCYGYSRYFETETCLGGKLPKSLLTTVRESSRVDLRFHPERKQDIRDILAVFTVSLNLHDRIFIKFNTTGLHAPIPYFPQAVGITIGKTLNLPPIVIFYFGRFSNFCCWLILAVMALRITPIGKSLFMLLLLTPMSLFQASSLSADAFTNGISFLWLAIILKLTIDHEAVIQSKEIRILSILSMLLCLAKIAYFPLLGLLFLLPGDKLDTQPKYYTSIASIFGVSLSSIWIWSSIVDRIYVPLSTGIFPDNQIEFILDRPWEFTATIWRTFAQEGLNYLHQFIGVLGWIDTPVPWFQVGSYFLLLVLVSVGDHHFKIQLSSKQKIAIASILAINTIVLSTLAYLWNPIGATIIGGLQGRYWIPLSPLLFLLFYQNRIKCDRQNLQKIVYFYTLFSCILTLCVLIYRYYI